MTNKDIIRILFVNAAKTGKWDKFEHLLEKVDNVNARDDLGNTALIYALRNDNFGIAELLIECGADVTPKGSYRGETALMWAAVNGRSYLVQLMSETIKDEVARKKFLNAQDRNGNTALMWVARKGDDRLETVLQLIEHGADKNIENDEGKTALTIALENGKKKIAEYLRSIGAKE